MEMKLSKNYKCHEADQGRLKSPYEVLQVTLQFKTLKQTLHFLWVVEVLATFNLQSDITLALFWEK